ncbi:replication protein [Citrobacter portucalensis]|uniref:replication protein n=1 Tax=Citrobacter portucalensis TaxID=1639133 RepID=UPI00226ACC75|nr:replication protein [Citrobacter portucalensis]MCX8972615.1 replication protein [Citrobacter portucalensis]
MGVVKLADYRSSSAVVELKVAQLEDGFLRLANELLDATMCSGLPETELCIVMAVWRKTYGFSKKLDWISNEQLEAMIAKHHTHCSSAKNSLIRKKVLIQEGRKIGMNTNISEWKTKNNGFCKTLAEVAKERLAGSAKAPKQKLLTTKDNNQKTERKDPPKSPKGECGGQEEKPDSQKKPAIDYQAVLSAYNSTLGDRLPQAEALNDKRRRSIKRLLSELKEPTIEAIENYFSAFSRTAKPFYFGDNDTGWRASFDYLLRSDTLVKTREGSL